MPASKQTSSISPLAGLDKESLGRVLEQFLLQQEIADESAASDIECGLLAVSVNRQMWFDRDRVNGGWDESVDKALRYLELRGLLKVHPTRKNLVRTQYQK